MVVILLERVPTGVRGELTRWMLEPKTGVFIGKPSAMVRQKLWEKVCSGMKGGAGMLIYSTDDEQGYAMQFWGATNRSIIDFDGLSLIGNRSRCLRACLESHFRPRVCGV